jgi:hypothetical protein
MEKEIHDSLTWTQQICITHFLRHNRQKIMNVFRGGTRPRERRDTCEDPVWPSCGVPWDKFQGERGELSGEYDEHQVGCEENVTYSNE